MTTMLLKYHFINKRIAYKILLHLLIPICSIIVQPLIAQAQENEDLDYLALSPQQLFSATVMSATKTSETWWDTPAAVYVLDNETIRRSGATSVPEVLRMVPGVQVAQVNTGTWAISVRGFNNDLANKLLVLIDGREVYDHLFSGVYWDVHDMVLEDVERIEVIRGPGGTLWGANAVNGVINIITKKAGDTQGAMVSAITGNQERVTTAARYGGRAGEHGYYRVYGKYLNRDEQKLLSGADAEDEWDAYRSGFRMDFERPEEQKSFTLQGDVYQSKPDQFRVIPSLATAEETILSHGGNLLGRYEYVPEDDAKLTVQSYLDYTFRDQLLLEDERTSLDIETQYEFPAAGIHKVIAGGRYQFSDDNLTGSSFVTFRDTREQDHIVSGFLQDKITLQPETWFLTLGSKLEHNNFTGTEFQPNARLQWHPNNTQILWASAARAVRTPNRLEHDLTILQFVVGGTPIIGTVGNTEFDSEVLAAYELGYRHKWTENLLFDVSAFYNDYDNLLVYRLIGSSPATFTYTPTNQMTAEAFGIETVADWRVSDDVNFIAAYSLMELQLHNHAANPLAGPESGEGRSPQHQFNVRSLWDITENVQLDSALYYVDALANYGINEYWRLDTRLGWQVTDQLAFDLVGQNLFNDVHREFLTTDPLGQRAEKIKPSVYGKLTWLF